MFRQPVQQPFPLSSRDLLSPRVGLRLEEAFANRRIVPQSRRSGEATREVRLSSAHEAQPYRSFAHRSGTLHTRIPAPRGYQPASMRRVHGPRPRWPPLQRRSPSLRCLPNRHQIGGGCARPRLTRGRHPRHSTGIGAPMRQHRRKTPSAQPCSRARHVGPPARAQPLFPRARQRFRSRVSTPSPPPAGENAASPIQSNLVIATPGGFSGLAALNLFYEDRPARHEVVHPLDEV